MSYSRGEGILVDADFADRRLRRQLPGGESVDVNLSAVRPSRRSGQRLQLRRQLVRIVGERVEVFALQDQRARAVFRTDIDRRRFFLHFDILLFHCDGKRNVELLDLSGGDLHCFFLIDRKTLSRSR